MAQHGGVFAIELRVHNTRLLGDLEELSHTTISEAIHSLLFVVNVNQELLATLFEFVMELIVP